MPDALLAREKYVIRQLHQNYRVPDQPASFTEPVGPGLNSLFVLTVDGVQWIGRKLPTQSPDRMWHLSSIIQPAMLLGPLTHVRYGDSGVTLHFITTAKHEKSIIFKRALQRPESSLYFPYPAMDSTGQELVIHDQDWTFSESFAKTLDADERHFRDYCSALLQHSLRPGAVLLDPACSTGTFIASLARSLPHTCCIGADRSLSMIEQARARHPDVQFYHRTAQETPYAVADCDVLLLRFLNAEVLTRDEAHALLRLLLTHLKPGATAIVFGHTPVLPNVGYLADTLGLSLKSSLASRPGHIELFEFYVLQLRGG